MRVLVTGATGFVGSHLTRSLVDDGFDVRALVRPTSDVSELEKLGVEIVRGELRDPDSVASAVRDCQRVFHMAAQMWETFISKRRYFEINVDGARNVARACSVNGVERMVHASSAGVYGVIVDPPVNEDSPLDPSSGYRESKWLAEQAVHQELTDKGQSVVIARLPGLMGPGSMNWLGLARAIATDRFRIIGNGENHDHVAYVSDVVDAVRLCAETPGVDGQSYLIASEEAVTVNQIIEVIARELGVSVPHTHLPLAPYKLFNRLGELIYQASGVEIPGFYRYTMFVADKILDISKAQRELGFQPRVTFDEGMRQSIAWYRDKNLLQPQ